MQTAVRLEASKKNKIKVKKIQVQATCQFAYHFSILPQLCKYYIINKE